MKPWIKLSIVVLITSSSAVRADIDFSQFDFKPFNHARKQPVRTYSEELTNALPVAPSPVVEEKQPSRPRIMLDKAPSEHYNDADKQNANINRPVLQTPQVIYFEEEVEAVAVTRNRAVVTADVSVRHHETGEVGLKLTECDQAINSAYYSNPPLTLECISKDEGTRYVAKSNRTARDGAFVWNYKTGNGQN
jgi:hypothetical protein